MIAATARLLPFFAWSLIFGNLPFGAPVVSRCGVESPPESSRINVVALVRQLLIRRVCVTQSTQCVEGPQKIDSTGARCDRLLVVPAAEHSRCVLRQRR